MSVTTKKLPGWLLIVVVLLGSYANPAAASLLGVELDLPFILFNNTGATNYTAGSDLFSLEASPIAIRESAALAPVFITPAGGVELVAVNIRVDDSGTLLGGVPGNDLLVSGEVTLSDGSFLSGSLLTAEITDFGFNDPGGTTDLFDFLFDVTGGLLADLFGGISADIGVTLTSEQSSFGGSFIADFDGAAKGNIGRGLAPPDFETVPEPDPLVLFSMALAGIAFARRKLRGQVSHTNKQESAT